MREIPASQEKPAEVVQQNRRNQIRTNNKQLCHFHTINNVPLHYVETGDRAKPSLVFAGSVLFGAEGFDDLVPLLEKDFHIIRIDVHGHGRSGLRIPLSLEKMADDCYDLLVPLGLSKPVWVGHSIGGMLGMRIAYKHPEAFAALVLSDHRTTRTAAVARSNLAALASVSRWSTGHHRRSRVAVLFCPSHFPHAAGVGSALSRLDHQLPDAENVFQCVRAVFERTDITEFLPRIVVPTLAIAGREDPAAPPAESQIIAERIPNARFLVIEQANRLVPAEKPREVAEAIRSFLRELSLGAG